jgi:hypothetical protein
MRGAASDDRPYRNSQTDAVRVLTDSWFTALLQRGLVDIYGPINGIAPSAGEKERVGLFGCILVFSFESCGF